MIYRILPPHEWQRLADYLAKHSYSVPRPESAVAAVAEDEHGEIRGTLIQAIVWHREPLVLDSPHVRFDKLNSVLNEAFTAFPGTVYYAFTDQAGVIDMARHEGMEPLQGVLLRGSN